MKCKLIIKQDENGVFVAECQNLPGVISQGNTRNEAIKNITDAIKGYFASLKKHNEPISNPIIFKKKKIMDHIAILNPKWKFLSKILSGEKIIESRWYVNKVSPYKEFLENSDPKKHKIYFKDSGKPITAVSSLKKIEIYDSLTPPKIKEILNKYYKKIGFEKKDIPSIIERYKNKNYCILLFLDNPREIKPFDINKKGFGSSCAWICTPDINKIKK